MVLLDDAGKRGRYRGRRWRRIGPNLYAPAELADDPLVRLQAASRRLPHEAVFSGRTAAFLHGLDTRLECMEATTTASHLTGITIRRARIEPDEVVLRKGFRVTSLLRTATDIACRQSLVEAVVILDAAMHRGVTKEQLLQWVGAHGGHRGIRRLREAVELAEPRTESPMETRLRLALVLAGLPRPQVQVVLPDAQARADLYYPDTRLVIEYDGSTHRDSLPADNRRQNRLVNAGYRILRFTAADLSANAAAIVRRALLAPARAPTPARA